MIVFAPLFIMFSILSGITEGVLYSRKGSDAFTWNEHAIYVSTRIVMALIFILPNYESYYDKAATVIFWLLAHSFFHDGAYFETRRRIDVSSYRWYTNKSNTSTAHWEVNLLDRCLMAAIGTIGFVIYCILK